MKGAVFIYLFKVSRPISIFLLHISVLTSILAEKSEVLVSLLSRENRRKFASVWYRCNTHSPLPVHYYYITFLILFLFFYSFFFNKGKMSASLSERGDLPNVGQGVNLKNT